MDPSQGHLSLCSAWDSAVGVHSTPHRSLSPPLVAGRGPAFYLVDVLGLQGTEFRICSTWHLTLKNESRLPSAGPEGKQRRKRQPGTPRLPGPSRSSGEQRPPAGAAGLAMGVRLGFNTCPPASCARRSGRGQVIWWWGTVGRTGCKALRRRSVRGSPLHPERPGGEASGRPRDLCAACSPRALTAPA